MQKESESPIFLDTHTHTTKLTALSSRHSQSALEYMMSYGWAILIIVIVAAALWSFGVFSPSNSVSTTINGFNGLGSVTAQCYSNLTGNGYSQNVGLVLTFGNGIGQTINITWVNVTDSQISKSFSVRSNDIIQPDGSAGIFEVPNVCPQTSGGRYSATVTVTYTEPGQIFSGPYFSSGSVSGTALAGSSFPSTVGLVAFWPFSEGSGTIVHDLSGNGHNGNINGTANWVANPRFGYVLQFNGITTDVNMTYVQTAVTQYTIFAWINMSTSSAGVIEQDRGPNGGHSLTLVTSNLGCGNSEGDPAFVDDSFFICIGKNDGAFALNNNRWYSLAGIFNSVSGNSINPGQFSIYVNGTAVAAANTVTGSDSSPLTGLQGMVIGYSLAWNTHFNGQITDFRVYNRTLTTNELNEMTLYNTLI